MASVVMLGYQVLIMMFGRPLFRSCLTLPLSVAPANLYGSACYKDKGGSACMLQGHSSACMYTGMNRYRIPDFGFTNLHMKMAMFSCLHAYL